MTVIFVEIEIGRGWEHRMVTSYSRRARRFMGYLIDRYHLGTSSVRLRIVTLVETQLELV